MQDADRHDSGYLLQAGQSKEAVSISHLSLISCQAQGFSLCILAVSPIVSHTGDIPKHSRRRCPWENGTHCLGPIIQPEIQQQAPGIVYFS